MKVNHVWYKCVKGCKQLSTVTLKKDQKEKQHKCPYCGMIGIAKNKAKK